MHICFEIPICVYICDKGTTNQLLTLRLQRSILYITL